MAETVKELERVAAETEKENLKYVHTYLLLVVYTCVVPTAYKT